MSEITEEKADSRTFSIEAPVVFTYIHDKACDFGAVSEHGASNDVLRTSWLHREPSHPDRVEV